MNYSDFVFKIPQESADYQTASQYTIQAIEDIVKNAIETGQK